MLPPESYKSVFNKINTNFILTSKIVKFLMALKNV